MVLPVYDDNPTHRRAYVTGAIIGANVIAFLLSPARWPVFGQPSAEQACRQHAFAERYGALPDELIHLHPRDQTFVFADGHCNLVSTMDHKHVALSLLTHMFVHGGWLHLLGNMLFLAIFGNNVEDRMGRLRFLAFYLGVGVIGAYGFAFTRASSSAPLVGASGAIAGILGAYLVFYPKAPITGLLFYLVPLKLPAWVVLGVWFLIQAGYSRGAGLTGGDVAYLVHAIGFAFGALYAFATRRRYLDPAERAAAAAQRPAGSWRDTIRELVQRRTGHMALTDSPDPTSPSTPTNPSGPIDPTGTSQVRDGSADGLDPTETTTPLARPRGAPEPTPPSDAGWTLNRQGWLPPHFLVFDPDGRYVGELQRRLGGGWRARNGWDDDDVKSNAPTRDHAFAVLRDWWLRTGRFMSGPQHDRGED